MCLENVVRALNTLSNQANYHKVGRVLDSPPLDAKCNMPIMRTCIEDVMGPRLRVRSGTDLGRVELIVKGLKSKKRFHNYCQNNNFTLQLNIEQQTP